MFEVTVEQTFAAGHALRHYKGKCENVHGHNYRVQVTVEGERLNSIGLLVDFVELRWFPDYFRQVYQKSPQSRSGTRGIGPQPARSSSVRMCANRPAQAASTWSSTASKPSVVP